MRSVASYNGDKAPPKQRRINNSVSEHWSRLDNLSSGDALVSAQLWLRLQLRPYLTMQHDKIVSKRTDITNQLIGAKDTQMTQIVMANDKKIDKLLASNAIAKARFLTEKKKAIESTRALKNAEISMLTMARDKDFDKMLEIMNAEKSMLTVVNDKAIADLNAEILPTCWHRSHMEF